MQEKLSNQAFKAVRWTTANAICQASIQLLTIVILGRLLGPEVFGLMAMIMVVVEVVNVFARMGLGEAIIHKKEVTTNEISTLFYLSIGVGSLLSVLVFLSSEYISWLYSEPDLRSLIQIISFVFFVSSLGVIFQTLLRKHLLFDLFCQINIASHFSAFLLMIGLALWGAGVYSLVWGQLFMHSAIAICVTVVAYKKSWLPNLHFRLSEIIFYLKFGTYRVLAMATNQFNSRVDQMLIGAILGPVTLGFYSIAFRIIYLPINVVSPILTQVAFPFFSKIQDDTSRLKKNYLKYMNLILSINGPVLVGIAVLAPVFIPLVLGDRWEPTIPIIQALAVYIFIRSVFNASGSLILAKGKAEWELYWSIAMLVVVPLSTYAALVMSKSVLGVCITLGGVFFVSLFVHYGLFLKRLLGGFLREYVVVVSRPLVLSIVMGVAIYLVAAALKDLPASVVLVSSMFVGLMSYGIMVLIFNVQFVEEMERMMPTGIGKVALRVRRMAGV